MEKSIVKGEASESENEDEKQGTIVDGEAPESDDGNSIIFFIFGLIKLKFTSFFSI